MSKIEIHKNSITNIKTDAVVNAANSSLAEGGGVCGAIFAAAGSNALATECAKYGQCSTGSAVITSACGMKNNKYIVHAVGPRYTDGNHREPELLYSCYTESLKLAKGNNCKSIGFPLISAGIFGYPIEDAWKVAIKACMDWIDNNPDYDMTIVFVRQHRSDVDLGKQIMAEVETERTSVSADSDEIVALKKIDKELLEQGISYLLTAGKVEWKGGGPSGMKTDDGKDIITWPYPCYDRIVFDVLELMEPDFNYRDTYDYVTENNIQASELTTLQLKGMLTSLMRGEHFCDGLIADYIENRYLLKMLLRLEDLLIKNGLKK